MPTAAASYTGGRRVSGSNDRRQIHQEENRDGSPIGRQTTPRMATRGALITARIIVPFHRPSG
jgi:hypothetical protein